MTKTIILNSKTGYIFTLSKIQNFCEGKKLSKEAKHLKPLASNYLIECTSLQDIHEIIEIYENFNQSTTELQNHLKIINPIKTAFLALTKDQLAIINDSSNK